MIFQRYLLFIVVLVAFVILFLRSGGFFSASADHLLKNLPDTQTSLKKETVSRALMILFLANLLGALLAWKTREEDTAAQGYLIRNEYGGAEDTKALTLTVDGEETDINLPVAARKLSDEEIREAVRRTAERLPAAVFGEEGAKQAEKGEVIRVCHSLTLPEKADGEPVRISWMTSKPDCLGFDGKLGVRLPEEGTDVTLTATLTCEEETQDLIFLLQVMPAKLNGTEAVQRKAEEAVSGINSENEEKVILPDTIDGKKAEWASRDNATGVTLLMVGLLTAVCYLYSGVRRDQDQMRVREERMRRDYPGIVNKLVLLLTAGLSLSKAFEQIAADYQRQKSKKESVLEKGKAGKRVLFPDRERQRKKETEIHPGYEEIVRTCREMRNGVSELDAYRGLGKRSGLPEYRTFSTVLAQNLRKGGKEMTAILEREASEAYENRKKHAAVLGEQAGTRILLPMLVMLLLVMVILMVPALQLL